MNINIFFSCVMILAAMLHLFTTVKLAEFRSWKVTIPVMTFCFVFMSIMYVKIKDRFMGDAPGFPDQCRDLCFAILVVYIAYSEFRQMRQMLQDI